MIELDIPGERRLALSHLALDFNGTLAFDGKLIHEVKPRLIELAGLLTIHVITGNTFGTATDELQGIPCSIIELRPEYQAQAKWEAIHRIGANTTVAIGNGRNDARMMRSAALAIAVLGPEGAARETVAAADIIAKDIQAALGLLEHRQRLIATLRT